LRFEIELKGRFVAVGVVKENLISITKKNRLGGVTPSESEGPKGVELVGARLLEGHEGTK
jgi:hypothetical protein